MNRLSVLLMLHIYRILRVGAGGGGADLNKDMNRLSILGRVQY